MDSTISHVLFELKVGCYYSTILKEDVSEDLSKPLVESYQVPQKGDIIKTSLLFEGYDEIEKTIEYTLEVQTIHYIMDDWGKAIIKVYANVVTERMEEITNE